jgi:hypothetical protein
MQSLSVDVLRYLLDWIDSPIDLLQFRQVSTVTLTVVNSEYIQRRVITFLGLHLSLTNDPKVQWDRAYYELTKIQPQHHQQELLFILLKYLPGSLISEWLDVHRPIVDLRMMANTLHFDLVPELRRHHVLLNTGAISPILLTPRVLFEEEYVPEQCFHLIRSLFREPSCPWWLLIWLNKTYRFIEVAEYQVIDLRKNYLLAAYLRVATQVNLTTDQVLDRIAFIFHHASLLRFDTNHYKRVLEIVCELDSVVVIQHLLDVATPNAQVRVGKRLHKYRLTLGPNLSKHLVAHNLTNNQVHQAIQVFLQLSDKECMPRPFWIQLFQHPLVTTEALVTQIIPKILESIRYQYLIHLELRESIWELWGISRVEIFLDPRSLSFTDNFYDTLYVLTLLPYNNTPSSDYFTLLVRLARHYRSSLYSVLAKHITKHQPELGSDMTLWKNLLRAGEYYLVTVLMYYSVWG